MGRVTKKRIKIFFESWNQKLQKKVIFTIESMKIMEISGRFEP